MQSTLPERTGLVAFATAHGLTPPSRFVYYALWFLTLAALPVWIGFDDPAWDAAIYVKAIHSLHAGHDPYADAMAVQKLVHSMHPDSPSTLGPFSYVYSPITLPVLRLLGLIPLWLAGALYWLCYGAGVLAETWFGARVMHPAERPYLLFLIPVAIFFPGMLVNDSVLSGNVAFILYGAAGVTAALAWRSGRWRWFYTTVLLASCVKAPLLSLLAIPVLSARRQWLPAGVTALGGVLLFLMQPFVWPSLFRNYLQAIELQFSFNRDFGSSPAGLFSGVLYDHHIPYSPACSIVYVLYAIPLFSLLLFFSRRFLRGAFSLNQWVPVLLAGVILLNPRIMEYDTAPLTLLMVLLLWRFFRTFSAPRISLLLLAALFTLCNALTVTSWAGWKITEGPLLVAAFAAGCWTLHRTSGKVSANSSANSSAWRTASFAPTISRK